MKYFLKRVIILFVLFFVLPGEGINAQQTPEGLGWKLGTQAYSFRLFTLEEALNKADSIGIKYVEGFPGQKIGAGIEGTRDYKMPASRIDSVLQLFKKKGIAIVSYGVVTPQSEADWNQLSQIVKGMGLNQLVSEPDPKFIPLV